MEFKKFFKLTYSFKLCLEKIITQLQDFSLDSIDSIIPEGAIISEPSGVKVNLLKYDWKVSSWNKRIDFPCTECPSGVGIFALLTRWIVFILPGFWMSINLQCL